MPSKEEEEENKLQKSRGRPKKSSPSQPGAQAAAATYNAGDEKTRSAHLPSELENLERSIAEKRRPVAPATTPGAFTATESGRADLTNLEADVAAKQRGRDAELAPQKSKKADFASKGSSRVGRDLEQLERDVNAKIQREVRPPTSDESMKKAAAARTPTPPSLDVLEQQIARKQATPELSNLEQRVASKAGQQEVEMVDAPSSLRQAEASALSKKDGGAETSMLEGQGPKLAGSRAGLGDSEKLQGDLEYGEYGGPDEQGLAVAFAVDEEADDAYIPSAVEFDPDAKPPMAKNRRFRMYVILAMIIVVVGCIGAAVGLTVAAKKTKKGLPYRETLGIREAAQRVVGTSSLEDPESPESKALEWIIHRDAKEMLPDDGGFEQRYGAAVFYYSTSVKQDWSGGCQEAKTEEEKAISFCDHEFVYPGSTQILSTPAQRWLSERDECSWYGVQCDEFGQIRGLELQSANMSGTIPEILLSFEYLQTLSLTHQNLEGPLPEKLFSHPHLVNLELTNNLLTGTIPEAAFQKNMQRMLLGLNNLSGSISSSIANLRDLKTFIVFSNELTGTIPTEIGNLRNLGFLRLGRNHLTGTLPTELGKVVTLNDMSTQRLNLTGTIPTELGLLTRMEDLRLNHNKLTGGFPSELYSLTRLHRLDVSENLLGGTLAAEIGQWNEMFDLLLHNNRFTGAVPTELGLLGELNEVQIEGNLFMGAVPTEVCPLSRAAIGFSPIGMLSADCQESAGVIALPCECCTHCCAETCTQVADTIDWIPTGEDEYNFTPV